MLHVLLFVRQGKIHPCLLIGVLKTVLLVIAPILSRHRLFLAVLLAVLAPLHVTDSLACSCGSEPDFLLVWAESDGAFQGTVIDILEGEGPRKVVFDIHLVQKGIYPYGKYVLEDTSVVYLEGDLVQRTSCEVYYKRGEIYQVFVDEGSLAGSTYMCTTKQISGFEEYSHEDKDGQIQHHRQYYSFFSQYGLISLILPVAVPSMVACTILWRRKTSGRHKNLQ